MQQQNLATDQRSFLQSIRYSIFPGSFNTKTDREKYRGFFRTLILHFRPRTVPERTLRFTLTWGLGGMAVVLVLMLFGTGVLLKFVYQPLPDRAYASVLHLQNDVFFGQLIRNVHHWSGNILLVIVFLHFLRAFFSGAFHPPRQFNWIIGLCLFLAVLISNFTGYLLPWDQLAFWAVTISTGILEYMPWVGGWMQKLIQGGSEMGPATLTNFFAIHTAVIPALLLILMPFHFWRVRKAGGVVVPRSPGENLDTKIKTLPAIPNLILRELVVALSLIAFILVVSVFFNAPLGDKANPGLSPNPTKAPWYFMGIQEMLLHFHPLFAAFILPVFIAGALFLLPYMKYDMNPSGVWFVSQKGRRMAIFSAISAAIATPIGIIADEFFVDFTAWLPGLPAVISNGLLPVTILAVIVAGFYLLLKKKYAATNNEAIQAIFVLLLVAFIILTITGVWFRGQGMALSWAWQVGVME
jgi:quinol-cytochrome oxidoreductase complex cytochrome b subunit